MEVVEASTASPSPRGEPSFGALEFHDVFKIYESGPAQQLHCVGSISASSRRDRRGARPVWLGQEHDVAARGSSRRSLRRRRARFRPFAHATRRGRASALPARESCDPFPARQPLARPYARENVALALRLAGRRADIGRRARRLWASGRESQRAASLSGGEQQRAAIAAAAARRARSSSPTSRLRSSTRRTSDLFLRRSPICETGTAAPSLLSRTLRASPSRPTGSLKCTTASGDDHPGCLPRRHRRYGSGTLSGGRSRVSASRWASTKVSRCSAGRAPARRPCCTFSAGSSSRPRAASSGTDARSRRSIRRARRGGARGIAYVFQGANLLPYFTALENVAFAAHARGRRRHEPAPAELLSSSASPAIEHLPGELSGGEAQRVAIARALAQRPNCSFATSRPATSTRTRASGSSTSSTRCRRAWVRAGRSDPRRGRRSAN